MTGQSINIDALTKVMSMEVMAQNLRAHWEYLRSSKTELINCKLTKIYPQKDGTFVLHYKFCLHTSGEKEILYFYGQLDSSCAKNRCKKIIEILQHQKDSLFRQHNFQDIVFCLPELGLVLRRTGLDEHLLGLHLFHQAENLLPVLKNNLELREDEIHRPSVEMLGHRLGKRCIFRITYDQHSDHTQKERRTIIAKLYKSQGRQGEKVYQFMKNLWTENPETTKSAAIPKPLAYSDEWKLLLMENIPGHQFNECAGEKTHLKLKLAGGTLEKLHKTTFEISKTHTAEDEIELLEDRVALVSQIFPLYRTFLNQALRDISFELNSIRDVELRLAHRDFYEKQILFHGQSATLIDFDTACHSDPAIDLGNFLAHIKLLRFQGIQISLKAENSFLFGYGAENNLMLNKRIKIYERSTLLRLACLYALRPQWQHLTFQLLKTL